jgi:hypothetical protein
MSTAAGRQGNFDSDLHAFIAGGIMAMLNFRNLESALAGDRHIVMLPQVDEAGNYLPEWIIWTTASSPQFEKRVFRLRLTEETA